MKKWAYYNEIDPFKAEWLRVLIKNDLIAEGEVDERDIRDVCPQEIRDFKQAHFFAGVGVWSYALRKAGWDDDRPVWTGSCPCQPFSAPGKQRGFTDERHLWPSWFHLVEHVQPESVFGEQVASALGRSWLNTVQADLEGVDYCTGAVDLCAAGVGAPHLRQRIYFVARSLRSGRPEWRTGTGEGPTSRRRRTRKLGDADSTRSQGGPRYAQGERTSASVPSPTGGFWENANWIWCRDNKFRAVEPGTFPLAHGATARVGRLRGYGDAIVSEVAVAFIEAAKEEINKMYRT